ncbi:MAG: DUF2975 domain-containing protein [Bacteroidales bacterium]
METKTNNFVFWALHVVAWIIFVGLCIEAGALLVNFLFNIWKPESVGVLYQKLDLSGMYAQNKRAFFGIYSFILTIAVLKAFLFYIVIRLMLRMELAKPFSEYVARQIVLMSHYTLSIGLISYIARQTANGLIHHGYDTNDVSRFWEDSQAFVLTGAVIYIIGAIFKKGVALQHENELTV